MSNGVLDWVNLDVIGPIYPFVGTEGILVAAAVVFWIWWHVRCIRDENREMNEAVELYRRIGVDKAMHPKGKAQLPDDVGAAAELHHPTKVDTELRPEGKTPSPETAGR